MTIFIARIESGFYEGITMKTKLGLIVNLIFMLSMACQQSFAASPGAWEEHYVEVREKCLQASALLQAKPAGEVVDFSDEIGFSMLIVRGIYAFDQKTPGTEVCLLNRSNRSVTITEADQLTKQQ